jgi:hypothetical protein
MDVAVDQLLFINLPSLRVSAHFLLNFGCRV